MKKNLMILGLAIAMLSGTAAFADEAPADTNDTMPISVEVTAKRPAGSGETSYYATVSDIKDGVIEAKDDQNTYTFSPDSVSVLYDNEGKKLTAADFQKDSKVKIFAHPTEDNALSPSAVILISDDSQNDVDVDYYVAGTIFGDLENAKFDLAIHLGEDTEIVDEDGKTVAADTLKNRKLMTFYQQVALSLPGQATPSKIVVLSDPAYEVPVSETRMIEDASMKTSDDHTALPLRKICEDLGYEVVWNGEKQAIQVGTEQMGVNLKIGENRYTFAKRVADVLEFAPTLIDDTTYVPVSFFSETLGMQTIKTSDGSVLIVE